jgi:hypothetical protein
VAIGTNASPDEMFMMAAFCLFISLGVNRAQRRMGAERFMFTSSSLAGVGLAVGDVKFICR